MLEEEGGALLLASGDESPSALPSGDIGGVLLQPPEGGSLGSPLGLRQHGWAPPPKPTLFFLVSLLHTPSPRVES